MRTSGGATSDGSAHMPPLVQTLEELEAAEAELFTGSLSEPNIRLYERYGYQKTEHIDQGGGTAQVFMRKRLRPTVAG